MVSLINFGNIGKVNGRTVSSGSQTGLDTTAIIEALAAAKRLPAVKFEDNIKINDNKINALTEMKSKLTALKEAVAKLRSPVGFSSSSTNAFEARTAFLSMSTGEVAANYVGVTAANGAPIGKYELSVQQVAVAENDLSEAFSSLSASVVAGDASGGPATGKFNAGTFNIGYTDDEGAPQSQSITLTAGSNLATVRDTINAKASVTGVKATIIKLSDTDYRLKLYATETGVANGYSFTAGTGTLVNLTNTPPLNAEFELDGEPIVRSSNVIDDLIDNVTFTLYQETPVLSELTLDIDKDNVGVATGVAGFLEAYNELKAFAATQSEYDSEGKLKETSYLHNNAVMKTVLSQLSTVMSGSKGAGLLSPDQLSIFNTGSSISEPESLSDLGIYFTDQVAVTDEEGSSPAIENILAVDVNKLNNNLQKYFEQTRALFEFNFISDNSQVSSYTRTNAVYENGVAGFTLNINHDTNTATVTGLVDASGSPLVPATASMTYDDSSGTVVITGADGGALEGMEFFFSGTATGTTTANITVSQGVGDVMFNTLDSYLSSVDGTLSLIDQEIENLNTQNDSAQTSIDRIDGMMEAYRDQMLARFAALEALVAASDQTLTLLDAQSNARNNG